MANGTLTEEVVEQVADHLEEAAVATRSLDTRAVGLILGGVAVGAVVGFVIGYRYNKGKLRAEAYAAAFEQSERELEQIREAYKVRSTAPVVPPPEAIIPPKPELDQIIEERQYQTVEAEDQTIDIDLSERPLKPPVPIDASKPVFRTEDAEKDKNAGWDYIAERARRTGEKPFIIHQDEYALNETDYNQVTYTYYAEDGVLADINDTMLDNVDALVGLNNLQRFGHGSDDFNVLFVRNPKLELDMEICRSNRSYEQEVKGLEHSDTDTFERMPHRRRRFDDDDSN